MMSGSVISCLTYTNTVHLVVWSNIVQDGKNKDSVGIFSLDIIYCKHPVGAFVYISVMNLVPSCLMLVSTSGASLVLIAVP